jgi:hypothetical protein
VLTYFFALQFLLTVTIASPKTNFFPGNLGPCGRWLQTKDGIESLLESRFIFLFSFPPGSINYSSLLTFLSGSSELPKTKCLITILINVITSGTVAVAVEIARMLRGLKTAIAAVFFTDFPPVSRQKQPLVESSTQSTTSAAPPRSSFNAASAKTPEERVEREQHGAVVEKLEVEDQTADGWKTVRRGRQNFADPDSRTLGGEEARRIAFAEFYSSSLSLPAQSSSEPPTQDTTSPPVFNLNFVTLSSREARRPPAQEQKLEPVRHVADGYSSLRMVPYTKPAGTPALKKDKNKKMFAFADYAKR